MIGRQNRLAAVGVYDAEWIAGLGRSNWVVDVRLGELGRRWCAVCTCWHGCLVDGDCTVGADLAGGDALAAVTEDVTCYQVHPAQDEDENTRCDYQTPERKAERLLTGDFFVEIAEHVDPQNDHCKSQSDESVSRTKQGPVAREEAAEERKF